MTRQEFVKRVADAISQANWRDALGARDRAVLDATLTVAAEVANTMFEKDYSHSQRKHGAMDVAKALAALKSTEAK